MNVLKRLFLWIFVFNTASFFAQSSSFLKEKKIGNEIINEISKEAYDTLIKRQFSKIITGHSYAGNYANYLSFDPVETSLTANAFLSFCNRVNSNVQIKTGLLDDKVSGLLVTDGNLNTSSSFDVKLNIRLDKQFIEYDMKEHLRIQREKHILRLKKQQDSTLYIFNLDNVKISIEYLLEEKSRLRDSISHLKTNYAQVSVRYNACGNNRSCRSTRNDTLKSIITNVNSVVKDSLSLGIKLDSLRHVLSLDTMTASNRLYIPLGGPKGAFRVRYQESSKKAHDKKLLEVEKGLKIAAVNVCWLSLGAGGSNQSIKSYNVKNPFSDQIKAEDMQSWSYNVAVNWLRSDSAFRKSLFLSTGLEYKQTNNLSDLTAFTINQATSSSDSTVSRQIKKEYSVYTDSLIKNYTSVKIFLNYYKFIGKKQNHAVHFSPDVTVRSTEKQVYNLLLGYVYSFIDSKTGKGKVNTELYVKFNDLTRAVSTEDKFSKRLQIGISFTLPFNIN